MSLKEWFRKFISRFESSSPTSSLSLSLIFDDNGDPVPLYLLSPPVLRSPHHPIVWWDDKSPSRSFPARWSGYCGTCDGFFLAGSMIGYVSTRYVRSGDRWVEQPSRRICCEHCYTWASRYGDPTLPHQRPRSR